MAAIGPGDLVKCIVEQSVWARPYGEALPVKGCVYTIRCVTHGGEGFRFVEIVNPPRKYGNKIGEPAFRRRGFIPLDDSALSIFRQHLHPAPKEPVEA